MPEWVKEFTAARTEPPGPVQVGTITHYTLERGDRTGTWEIVEWDPPRRVAWDGPPLPMWGGGARPRGSLQLAPAGEGCTVLKGHYHPEVSGPPVLLRPYLKRWLRRQRTADAQKLKSLLEAGRRP
jgi:hypothetical protein